MSVLDLIDEQDDYRSHNWNRFVLWPKQWQQYQNFQVEDWQCRPLAIEEQEYVPKASGIYTLIVQPNIFNHPACAYLMYVGKTTSLNRRFKQYLNEKNRENGRPKILRLLHKYSDHTWFYFTIVPENDLSYVEDAMLSAYLPPCNDRFPTPINQIVNASL